MFSQPRQMLSEETAGLDPFALFERWYAEALSAGIDEPAAMALATSTAAGEPSVRMVLLRGFDSRGFVFFTNYRSRKAAELTENPRAALVLYWHGLDRQVRIEGIVTVTSAEESDAYFRTRPEGSRLGAWASPQSEVVAGREVLETEMVALERRFPNGNIPRPENWGGYRVVPHAIEFWESRESRLHDRLRFVREGEGWRRERLAP